MNLNSAFTSQFEKDLKLCKKRKKDLQKLKKRNGIVNQAQPITRKTKRS